MSQAGGSPGRIRNRIRRLARQLGRTGLILVGTIRPRWIAARHGASKRRLGPYYQWTFKEAGKTVTVNLSPSQVKPFQAAIARQRAVERLLEQMRRLSRQWLDATTQGVARRKPQQ